MIIDRTSKRPKVRSVGSRKVSIDEGSKAGGDVCRGEILFSIFMGIYLNWILTPNIYYI